VAQFAAVVLVDVSTSPLVLGAPETVTPFTFATVGEGSVPERSPPAVELIRAAELRPRLVRAVVADCRSERLLAFCAARASAASARVVSVEMAEALVVSAPWARVFSTDTAESAYAVVAIWVFEVSAVAVGARGVPVRVGLERGALRASAVSARVVSTPTALSA
jgi:hypothetical protein